MVRAYATARAHQRSGGAGTIALPMDMETKRRSSVLVLSQDGWSNIMNNPIIAHSLFAVMANLNKIEEIRFSDRFW